MRRGTELHMETLNMMAKYQMVYLKLESTVLSLARMCRTRHLVMVQRAFERLRSHARTWPQTHAQQVQSTLQHMKAMLATIIGTFRTKQRLLLISAVGRWRRTAEGVRVQESREKAMAEVEERHKKAVGAKDQTIAGAEQKLRQCAKELAGLKDNEKALKLALKEKEDREKTLKENLENHKKRESEDKRLPKKTEDKILSLEQQMKSLEGENRELRERLEATDENVGGFIQEMTDVLDSHEFLSMCAVSVSP
jgi:chromosome segregation ATPase